MDVIRVDHLSYSYKSRVALRDISFTVHGGEIFGLLGPNGGGKSTAFRILSTFLTPGSGRVEVLDLDVSRASFEIRKKIGVVFQSSSMDRQLTVRENLVHQGHLYGWKGRRLEQRVQELLQRFGLGDRMQENVGTLSGGLRRRAEIAKGVLHQPEVLLLDEPSTGLDPAVRLELWSYLDEIRSRDGATILLTTHFLEEAERCDRLAVLDQGQLIALGSPDELKREVGGEVVTIQAGNVQELARNIQDQFGLHPTIVNDAIRIELPEEQDWFPKLVNVFHNRIDAITLGKPTLEDVFIHYTGHRMEF